MAPSPSRQRQEVASPRDKVLLANDDGLRYFKTADLLEMVKRGDVKLVRASWLAQQGFLRRKRLSCRQVLESTEPEAYADVDMVEQCFRSVELSVANSSKANCDYPGVVVVSYCWLTAQHPDPEGTYLTMLAPILEWYASQRAATGRHDGGYFDFCVFVDYWSLHQGDRNEDEEYGFRRARDAMDAWYGHTGMMTWLMTKVPKDYAGLRKYNNSGWTTFERYASSGKKAVLCLDVGKFHNRQKLDGNFMHKSYEELKRQGDASCSGPDDEPFATMIKDVRAPPTSPEVFETMLDSKRFADESDKAAVSALYERVASPVMGSARGVLDGAAAPEAPSGMRLQGWSAR